MIINISARKAWLIGLIVSVGMMAYALYAQYVLELFPCPLCVFQRIAVIAFILVALIALLHNPKRKGQVVYGLLGVLSAGAGVGIAGRHVWLQGLPADQVPSCGAGLEFMLDTLPLFSVIEKVLSASGECAQISWQFLGLSMPAWVAIGTGTLTIWSLMIVFVFSRPLPQTSSQ
ncbi:MAG: disulfide bond formation protein B [Woeseiaceae bacterium]